MNTSWLLRLLTTGLLALAAVAPASVSTVAAARPDIVTTRDVVIDRVHPGFTAACGFPVQLHAEGFYRTITHLDEAGNPTMVIDQAVFNVTLSANGTSINGHVAGPAKIVFNEDGTLTISVLGVSQRHVPGAGIVAGMAGRVVLLLTLDANGEVIAEDVVFQAGLNEPRDEVCPFLGAET